MIAENTQTQMRKGILEYCVLLIISRGEIYASDIIAELKSAKLLVVEGTLYPLLTRLKNNGLLSYNWVESTSGPPRKYYMLTPEGVSMLSQLDGTWQELSFAIAKSKKQKDNEKTLNINIGNSIIHIEEDAYEILTAYLIEVKQHFGKSADDFEIVSDIENRIAEMFSEILLAQQKPVIELEDVQVVMQLMGSVKDFEGEAEEEPARAYSQHSGFTASGERKIYRDTDDAMVAGVCSGLSHYLQMDVSIIRVIAALTILLGGSGLIAYLILWLAMPKAATRAEKMAMKGEAATLQGFKRSFEEELFHLKDSLRGANDHLQPLIRRSGSVVAEFVEVLGVFLQGAGKTIIKVIAVIMVIWASLVFLGAVIAVAAILGFWDSSTSGMFPLSMVDAAYLGPFILAVFVVIAVPMIALVLLSIRVAFNTRTSNKMVSYGLLLIWLCGLAVGIFYVAKVSTEFKEEAEFTQNIAVKKYPEYTLELDKSRFFSKEDSLRYRLNSTEYHGRIIMNDRDAPFRAPRNVTIRIEKGDTDVPSLVETYGSQGINFETALYHAKNIRYDFTQQDSVLRFSPELHLNKNTNWRNQRIELVLRVPVGAKVNISRNLDRYLQDYSLWDCGDDNRDEPYHGLMTAEGLTCRDHH